MGIETSCPACTCDASTFGGSKCVGCSGSSYACSGACKCILSPLAFIIPAGVFVMTIACVLCWYRTKLRRCLCSTVDDGKDAGWIPKDYVLDEHSMIAAGTSRGGRSAVVVCTHPVSKQRRVFKRPMLDSVARRESAVLQRILRRGGESGIARFARLLGEHRAVTVAKRQTCCLCSKAHAMQSELPDTFASGSVVLEMEYAGEVLTPEALSQMDVYSRISLAAQAVEIVAFLNGTCGIEWGDCKLSNILVDCSSVPGVMRLRAVVFGEALRIRGSGDWLDDEAQHIPKAMQNGDGITPEYCSPERFVASQTRSPIEGDMLSDAWSLGVLLFTVLTGGKSFWEPEDNDPLSTLGDTRLLALHVEKSLATLRSTHAQAGPIVEALLQPMLGNRVTASQVVCNSLFNPCRTGLTVRLKRSADEVLREAAASLSEHRIQVDNVLQNLQPKVPLPQSIHVEAIRWNLGQWTFTSRVAHEVVLYFHCARGSGRVFELRSKEWRRWLRLSLNFLKASAASWALFHGAVVAAPTVGASASEAYDGVSELTEGSSLNIFEFCREMQESVSNSGDALGTVTHGWSRARSALAELLESWGQGEDETDLDKLLHEAILLPSEQEFIIAELRAKHFFESWDYDATVPGWYWRGTISSM